MEATSAALALQAMEAALDSIAHGDRERLAHRDRLELATRVRRVKARVEALEGVLVGEADKARSSVVVTGTPTTGWLQGSGASSRGEAAGLVFAGRDLAARPLVRQAALAGTVTMKQARAIAKVISALPVGLTPQQRREAERVLIDEAAHTDADHLARLGQAVLARVAPEAVDDPEAEQRRLEAQRARAHAARSLSFTDDGDGSWRLSGLLPHLQAAPLLTLIDARVESARRACRDAGRVATGDEVSPAQRRADAVCALAADAFRAGQLPVPPPSRVGLPDSEPDRRVNPPLSGPSPSSPSSSGRAAAPGRRARRVPGRGAGGRPRLIVTMSFDKLRVQAEQAGLLDSGQPVTAGDLRQLACDADLVPAVLGGHGEVLDYGRAVRLVPPALRGALGLRDGGCVFPGCDVSDTRCDAHHLIPWWAGGETSLANLVSLCPHHHALVEPPRFFSGPPPDRWQVRLDDHGLPEFLPPRGLDPSRTPRRPTRRAELRDPGG